MQSRAFFRIGLKILQDVGLRVTWCSKLSPPGSLNGTPEIEILNPKVLTKP